MTSQPNKISNISWNDLNGTLQKSISLIVFTAYKLKCTRKEQRNIMPRIILITRKRLVLANDKMTMTQRLLNEAYRQSDLVSTTHTKADAEEFCGSERQQRSGLLSKVLVLYEDITEQSVGGHERILPQEKYVLDAPARKLQEAYVEYLNFVFHGYITPENTEKKDKTTAEDLIDDGFVYLREILIRLFTAAISINKNNSAILGESKKIVRCLELFVNAINKTDIVYNQHIFSSDSISGINLFFANEHKEWIFLLNRMREMIENTHKHTATISNLIETLNKAKYATALQLIAYISPHDVAIKKLSPNWIKDTLFECEVETLEEVKKINSIAMRYNLAKKNYDALSLGTHQKHVIKQHGKNQYIRKLTNLYDLLAKTNVLLSALDQIDILLTATGWILIITNVIDLKSLSVQIEKYSQDCIGALKFDAKSNGFSNKENIKKVLVASGSLSAIDFVQDLELAVAGLHVIQSDTIKNCISNMIYKAIDNLRALESSLGCSLINPVGVGIFAPQSITLLNSKKTSQKIGYSEENSSVKSKVFFLTADDIQANNLILTLQYFESLVSKYEAEGKWHNKTDNETFELFKNVRGAKNDSDRAQLVLTYLQHRTQGRFYDVLTQQNNRGLLFARVEQENKIDLKSSARSKRDCLEKPSKPTKIGFMEQSVKSSKTVIPSVFSTSTSTKNDIPTIDVSVPIQDIENTDELLKKVQAQLEISKKLTEGR